ncbi:MAG: helicase-associated domain-containing protein [Chloroflexi bacterium]|nr:helicase-associated domain-containing protein [Chloroflexota bacterium]
MRNLFAALLSRSPHDLERIAASWDVKLRRQPHRDNVALLSREMLDDLAARDLLDSLTSPELSSLSTLLGENTNSISPARLAEALSTSESEASERLASLFDKGLVYSDGSKNPPPIPARTGLPANREPGNPLDSVFIPRELAFVFRLLLRDREKAVASSPDVESLLRNYDTPFLEEMGKGWGVVALPGRFYRDELIQMIGEAISEPAKVERVSGTLEPQAALVFRLARDAGGVISLDRLREETQLAGPSLREIVRQLTNRALAFEIYDGPKRVLVAPKEITEPSGRPPAHLVGLETINPARVDEGLTPYALAWDLLILLDFVANLEVESVPGASRFPKRLIKSLNDRFVCQEDLGGATPRLDFLHHCALAMKLVRWDGRRLIVTDEIDAWVNRSFTQQMGELYRTWLENARLDEPAAERATYRPGGKLLSVRKKIVSLLASCEVRKWYAIASLIETIKATDPFFLRSRQDLVRERGRHALDRNGGDWDYVEGRLVAGVLVWHASEGGVVNLGRNERGELAAFQLTDLGAELLKAGPVKAGPARGRSILVQPSFEILVFAADAPVVWNLLHFARLVRHDRVSTYTLDRESVLAGLRRGLSIEGILDFLQQSSRREIPQNVTYSLRDWGRLFRPVRLRWAPLLEVGDPALREEILSVPALASQIEKTVSPTELLVRSQIIDPAEREALMEKLARELKKSGFYPEIE